MALAKDTKSSKHKPRVVLSTRAITYAYFKR